MAGSYRLEVVGLKEARAALREIDPKLSKEVTKAHRMTATLVVSDARVAAVALGGVHRHAARGIRPRGGQGYAGVAVGANHPEGAGAEFGGGRRKRTRQFPPYRGNGPTAGYAVYPTIRRLLAGGQIEAAYLLALDVALRQALGSAGTLS